MKRCFRNLQILLLMCVSAGMICADGPPPATADFTENGTVDLADYSVLAASWLSAFPWFPDGMLPQKIAHWQLDNDAVDSQSTFDGVIFGDPAWYLKKDDPNEVKIGSGAVGMNGHDYIAVDASRFPHFYGSFTLEVWIRTNTVLQPQVIVSKGSWEIGIQAGTGTAYVACSGLSGTNYLAGNTFLADGLWHHLAGVYDQDAETLSIYLDGEIDAQTFASGSIGQNDTNIRIGGNPETGGNGWHGTIDNLCVYNYALTLQQVFDRNTYHVDVKNGTDAPGTSDPEWGKGRLKPFKTIQHAIDVARGGDLILVWPGVYQESLYFMGKAVTVRSAADAAILEPDPSDGIAVTFMYGEQADSVLEHFIIVNSDIALYIHQSSPTLKHLTVVNNDYGVNSIFNSHPAIEHCIFWDNRWGDVIYDTYCPEVTYSCIQRAVDGPGNISVDPLFVNPDVSDPNTMDFHLQAKCGRYLSDGTSVPRPPAENWMTDTQTSPCVDAGRPEINPFCETMCNGGRINMGAYGNTPFASKSPWALPADMDYDGHIFLEDLLMFAEQWLTMNVQ